MLQSVLPRRRARAKGREHRALGRAGFPRPGLPRRCLGKLLGKPEMVALFEAVGVGHGSVMLRD